MLAGKYDQQMNSILSASKICFQTSLLLGVLVTITYCGVIGYYPSGLTIGDSLFFVAASLAFAFTYSLVVAAFLCAGITISPFLRWLQPVIFFGINLVRKMVKKPPLAGRVNFPPLGLDRVAQVLLGLLIMLIIASGYFNNPQNAASLTLTVLAMGFMWGAWNTKPRRREYKEVVERRLRIGFAILIYLISLIIVEAKGSFLNQSMSMIGVRAESRVVQLDRKHTEFLRKQNINPSHETDQKEGVYEGVLAQFRGIGTNTAIEVNGFSLSVPSTNIIIGGSANKSRNGKEESGAH